MTTVTFNASSTWTAPAGVTSVQAECWGPGGNGANGLANSHSGGGGGGGEYAAESAVAVTPGTVYSFTVGAGGSGTSTVFTGDTQSVTAHAGASGTIGTGGTGSTNTTHNNGGGGGAGHTGTGNQGGGGGGGSGGSTGAGGTGGNGTTTVGGSGGTAGSGGGAAGGAGAAPLGSATAGTTPGGGGGGGKSTSTVGGAGAAGADGQITLTYTATTTHSGTATLTGSGTLSGTGAFAGSATLSGSGTLSGTTRILKATVLSGSGTLQGSAIGTISETMTFSGSGTLTGAGTAAIFSGASLSGSGTMSGTWIERVSVGLAGIGTLTIIGTGGTVAASAGAETPYAYPGTSQVAVAPPGSSSWRYLGQVGEITALTYSFACPGGADKMSCTVMAPATYRTDLFNPGWQVKIVRGGTTIWTGKLDEPTATRGGWNLTAVGDGARGQDFRAVFSSTWPAGEPDQIVNNAISRGLPWVNTGIGTPTGAWFGQAQDSASGTVTDILNLICTRGGLTWYVNSQPGGAIGSDISVFPLPVTPNRLLVVTDPVSRTLGGDINTIFIRYQVTDASSAGGGANQQATYATTSVQNAASVAAHDVIETYVDLSSAGVMTASAAQAVGNQVLAVYQRASFAGPFTGSYGQLLNTGGQPIDPGMDQAGTVVKLILTDFGYGGEVTPAMPITFLVGGYTWDDFAQKFQVTAYQNLDQSLSGLLSMETTVLTPITTQP